MAYTQSPPFVDEKWLASEETPSGERTRDFRSDQRIGSQPKKVSDDSLYSFGRKDLQVVGNRPSIGRRISRSLTRFFAAVLIGVGATLGWQSYGDAARQTVVARVPTLAWLLPVSATKSPVAAETAPASLQQSASWASDLDIVRRSVEQLVAKQEQIVQNIAALQAVDEDIRMKMSYMPPSASQPLPQQKPAQPRAQSPSVPRPQPAGPLLPPR